MLPIDPLSLIPESLKTAVRDAAVDFVSAQAKKFLGDAISTKIMKLRSDADFNKKFEQGLKKALQRFAKEYAEQDEDLAAAIESDPAIFNDEQVKKTLLEMLKNPGKYLIDEHATISENFSTVLHGRKNRERVDKAISFLLRCLAEELWNLPELQPIYSLQFQRMTAESMRQQVELQKAQLQALTTVNEGVRQALLQLTDAIAEKKLLPGPGETLSTQIKVLHNLPNPNFGKFVGRKAEIKTILEKLQPYPLSQVHLVTIDGIGGVGKSALALNIAYHFIRNYEGLPENERFDAIIWTSAKKTILTVDGIKTRHQVFQTLNDIYTVIAVTFGQEELTKAKPEEQAEKIRNLLSSKRCLLVVDNLETVDDETVISFLMELPAPTKAIVTTRHRIDLAYPVRLLGMPEKDAISLATNECKEKGVGIEKENLDLLIRRTGGVPLAIVWSIAQILAGYGIARVLNRLGEPSNDMARFCFEGVIEKIKANSAFQLLLALSIFKVNASREALGVVTKYSEVDRDDGLVLLEKLSLVNKQAARFSMLPLTKDYANAILKQNEPLLIQLRHQQRQYYLEILADFSSRRISGEASRGTERHLFQIHEYENILDLVDWSRSVGELDHIPDLIRGISANLWARGLWNIVYQYGEIALALSREGPTQNQDMEAYFSFRLGRIDLMRNENDIAEKLLKNAIQIYSSLGNISRLAHSASYLGLLYIGKNDLGEAEKLLVDALTKARIANDATAIARIQNVIGQVYVEQGYLEKAEQAILEAKEIREKKSPSTGLAASHELLGQIKLKQGEPAAALPLFIRCYEIAQMTNAAWYMAFAKKWMADSYFKLGDLEKAQASLLECIKIFAETGMKERLLESEKMLSVVSELMKKS